MKTQRTYTLVLFVYCIALIACAYAGDDTVLVVNDLGDIIQTVAWHNNTSLYDLTRMRDRGAYTKTACVIDGNKLQIVVLSGEPKLRGFAVPRSSIVIFGALTAKREARLRQNPVLDNAFKALPPMKYVDF